MEQASAWPLLDRALPAWGFHNAHSLAVAAPAPRTWQSLVELRGREVRLLGPLMWVRRLGLPPAAPRGDDRPLLDAMAASGFVRLCTEPGREVVLGTVGRFWSWKAEFACVSDPDAFAAFAERGYAKAVMGFRVTPQGGGRCRVDTETRIHATDAAARRKFALYWRVVAPGSALIRRSWLQAIRRRAEAS
jgi:hypothetical protein